MIETMNEWVNVRNGFVRKTGERVFEVVRIEDSGSEYIYYETYSKVDLNRVSEEDFKGFDIGNFEDYSKQETDEEKAFYYAFHALQYNFSCNCEDFEEVTKYLQEDGIIPENETFEISYS